MMFNNDTKWQGNNYNAFQSLSLAPFDLAFTMYQTMYDDEIK